MTLYYIKQENTVWCCEADSGEYFEDIVESFIECKCLPDSQMTAEHLHHCNGGGPVLKWRKAKPLEIQAFYDGQEEDAESNHYEQSIAYMKGQLAERERIIKMLENQHNFDQIFLDAVDQVIALIKGENK